MKTLIYKSITKADSKEAFRQLYNDTQSLEFENGYIALFEADKARSLPQNRYYWGVVIKMLSELTGYEPEILHEFLCGKFIGERSRSVFDKLIMIRQKSSSLSASEFSEYIEKIRFWAFDKFGDKCDIPDPDGLPASIKLGIFFEQDKR
jgi:hypothetical protein